MQNSEKVDAREWEKPVVRVAYSYMVLKLGTRRFGEIKREDLRTKKTGIRAVFVVPLEPKAREKVRIKKEELRNGGIGTVFVVPTEPKSILVAPFRSAIEPLVHPPQRIQAARVGGIGVVDDAVLEGECAHAGCFARIVGVVGSAHFGKHDGAAVGIFGRLVGRLFPVVVFDAFALLLLGERRAEVVVEVGAEGGGPREGPTHPLFVCLELRERGARDGPEHDVVVGEMDGDAVEAVGDGGTGGAAGGVIGAKHEMVNEKLGAAAEQIGERTGAGVSLEAVFHVDPDPGEFLALFRQLVAAVGVFFLGGEKFFPCGEPFFPGNDFVHARQVTCDM